MRYLPIDVSLFIQNRGNFVEKMKKNSVAIFNSNDEMFRNGDQFYPYRQNSDLFYLSGIDQEQSILVLAPDFQNPKYREILFIRDSDKQLEIWFGHKLTKLEAQKISGIKNIKFTNQLEGILRDIILESENIYFNFNEYFKFKTDYLLRDHRFAKEIREKYPSHNFERSAPILNKLRIIKSDIELDLIKKACDITSKAFYRILKFIKPGVKEFEIQAEIEHEFTMNAANGTAYQTIVASGINACILHYTQNDKVCEDGELLLLDFGAEYANYAADLSCTVPVNGKFSTRQREVYEAVLRVQKKAIQMFRVGNTIEKLNIVVNKLMEKEIVKLGLMDKRDACDETKAQKILFKYFMHGTSHFLGLDVHDVGFKTEPFKPGMVFTCEPALYIKEEKLGVRIENNILVTKDEPVNLMPDIPVEPDEIEALMSKK